MLAIAIGLYSYYELTKSRNDLQKLAKTESENIIKALKISIENNLRANAVIYDEIINYLIATASLAEHQHEHKLFDNATISKFSKLHNLDLIIIEHKNNITSNIINLNGKSTNSIIPNSEEIELIKNKKMFWQEIGLTSIQDNEYYLIGGFFNSNETMIIVGINELRLLDLRKDIGIGKLINNISLNEEISYIALQDSLGLIAASRNIKPLSTIHSDSFLVANFHIQRPKVRFANYHGIKIMESVIAIKGEEHDMVLRLGISLQKIRAVNQRNTLRTIFLSVVLLVIAIGSVAFVYQTSLHRKLREDHLNILEYNKLLLSNINDAVVGIDNKKNIIFYNHRAEDLFGSINTGSSYFNLFPNDEIKLSYTLDKSLPLDYLEIHHQHYKGDQVIMSLTCSIIKDTNSKPFIALAVLRDITEIKKQEEIENRNEKLFATAKLAAGVAHEIRNPLNSIGIITQRLELEFEPGSDKVEYYSLIKTVRHEISRLNKIVTQFLDFSRIKPTLLKYQSLNEIIAKVVRLSEPVTHQNKVVINFVNEKEYYLELDSDKIEQLLINLINNSIEASDTGGRIDIELSESVNSITIAIKDTGKGMPEEVKKRAFDIYFTTKEKGTGLGLGISNKIVQEHNGKIWFESMLESGTTFYIELPKLNKHEQI